MATHKAKGRAKKGSQVKVTTWRAGEVWGGHFFGTTMDRQTTIDLDPHSAALRASAGRLVYHAGNEIACGDALLSPTTAAMMLREAALLMDLLRERLRRTDEEAVTP